MSDEGNLAVKLFRLARIMIVAKGKKSWQIPVPAAAVIQEGLALFGVIGCKGYVGCFFYYSIKV